MASGLYAQTELGSEDDLTALGVDGTVPDPDTEIKGFTVFGSTNLLTHISTAPGNVVINGALEVSSDVYVVGKSTFADNIYIVGFASATKYYGDGSSLTGISGDNLGNHNATQRLNMGSYAVWSSSDITAARYQINGSTMVAVLPGVNSIAYGVGAGAGNITGGNYNVFIGNDAGASNTTGIRNTANGYQALYLNTTGIDNTANGYAALFNTTGGDNTANGYAALYLNTTGTQNTATGGEALRTNTTGGNNTANGYQALHYNQTGSANSVFGVKAGGFGAAAANSFSSSTIMGYQAGYNLTTGSDNTFLGWQSGYNVTTGTGNIVIGYDQRTSAISASNELNIGGVLFSNLSARTIGISTRVPQAALDIVSTGTLINQYAQIWRASDGTIVSSMTATGVLYPQSVPAGDDLGNHTGTQALNMGGFDIINASSITVAATKPGLTISTDLYVMNGNVGIGTTTTTSAKLVVSGDIRLSAGDAEIEFNSGGPRLYAPVANTLAFHTGGGFGSSSLEAMRIHSSGRIGVGLPSPNGLLHVRPALSDTTTAVGRFEAAVGGYTGTSLIAENTLGAASTYRLFEAATDSDGDAGGRTVHFVIRGDGNVGIGTAAPGAMLEVAGQVKITGGSPGAGKVLTSNAAGLATWVTASGDNLGNHTGTQVLQMGAYGVNTSSNITAARYQINGSTVLAILAGADSLGVGVGAGINTSGGGNSFVGYQAGYTNTSGGGNSFVGKYSGYSNTTGSNNVAIGYTAGYFNTSGSNNSFIGNAAGSNITTGEENSFVGKYTGRFNQTGSANAIFGNAAGGGSGSANSFSSSTLVGYRAGYGLTTGSDNILLGWQAGDNLTSGARNILLGYDIDAPAAASSDFLSVGNLIFATGGFGAGTAAGAGNVGIGTAAPGARLEVAGQVKITGGSPGAGKVLTSDAAGLATWGTASGDNLGNHTATSTLDMANFNIVGVSTITISSITTTAAGVTFSTNVYVMSGNVGIGTKSPGASLHIVETDGNALRADGNVSIRPTAGSGGVIQFKDLAGSLTYGQIYPNYIGGVFMINAAGNPLSLTTSVADLGRLYMSAAGNVGIGTQNPGVKLEVAGQIKITGGAPGAGKVLTSDAAGLATWGTASGDNLGNHTATQALNMADKAVDNVSSMTVTGTGVTGAESLFSVAGSTLVALNNGNVGIGTNSPGYPLEIKPSGMAGFQVEPQAGYVSLRVNGVEVARLVP